jgi:WD40 repeat protein
VALVTRNGAQFWETQPGAFRCELQGSITWDSKVVFSPNGQLISSKSPDNFVQLWDTQTGTLLRTFHRHTSFVLAVAFSPDSRLLALASDDKTVRLWSTYTGALLKTLTGQIDTVSAVAFSPDGRTVATSSWDRIVELWDTATGSRRWTFDGSVYNGALAFSPNGELVAYKSGWKEVQLWDTLTGAHHSTLEVHSDDDDTVVFSLDDQPDHKLYLIADEDHSPLKAQTMLWTKSYSGDYTISRDKCWVVWKGHDILWLPPEYRPQRSKSQGNVLVMRTLFGRVIFMYFQTRTQLSQLC